MKAKIEIECDDIRELVQHLSEITRQVKKEMSMQRITPQDEFSKRTKLEDNNCYGTHTAIIIPTP